jgi:hypothetical protein
MGSVLLNFDGFAISPEAALRFNFFYAVPEGRGPQGPLSPVFARLASGAFYEAIVLLISERSSTLIAL